MPDDPAAPPDSRGARDLDEMWKALLAGGWTSLAIVPTDHHISVQAVVDSLHRTTGGSSPPVRCIDSRGTDVSEGKAMTRDLERAVAEKSRVVVVVDALVRSLSGMHLVHEVNAILLVVRVGSMDLDSLTSTVAMVGAERIFGSVTAPVEP
jgi:hypothetical protein